MEEFIFGTMANDALKLVYHRASRSGVQHAYNLSPRDPVPGKPVTLAVALGPDVPADHAACYYTLDGSQPGGSRGQAVRGEIVMLTRTHVEWDTLIWGYRTRWQGTIPAQPDGAVVRYRIGVWQDGGEEIFADWPAVKATQETSARAFFRGEDVAATPLLAGSQAGTTFNYHVDTLAPPAWAREAVIYQIFVDRFHPGAGRAWLQTDRLREVVGGTLWGVAEQMDHVAELGATCVWLSPIFPSPTPHGYDATDFFHVEPRLGGEDALHAVVEAAHKRGIRVILDLAINHISNQHPRFVEAHGSTSSPYRSWFHFDDPESGYRTFFGVRSMPQVNVHEPAAREWLLDIGRHWLREFDVDGYRLDHANGPGPGFWSDFWAACKAEKPDCFVFGEIVEPPEVLRQYVGRMDGTLDFFLAEGLRRTFAYGTWTPEHLEAFIERHLAYFGQYDFLMLSFLDNHDMDRFLFIAGDDQDALRAAATVQMRLPNPPVIYYGTEVGMTQLVGKQDSVGLEASRMPMRWGDAQDRELFAFYQRLIRERQAVKPWL